MALVFQYGSNMATARLNSGDRLKGTARPVGIAVTEENYRFVFDIWSKDNDCAAADIVEGSGRKIWGVVYEVPDRLIQRDTAKPDKSLDAIEGEGTNYRRIEITARWSDGVCIDGAMLTYVGMEAARRPNIKTSQQYVQHILTGLKEHEIPGEYVSYVKQQIEVNNPQLASDLKPTA